MAGLTQHRRSILLCGILLLSLLIAPVAGAKLATPMPVSPANNQNFYHADGTVYLTWKVVPGANQYATELQRKVGNNWEPYSGYLSANGLQVINIDTSSITAAGETFRWRVTARDTTMAKDPSSPSTWRSFRFIRGGIQLATPVLEAPPSSVAFSYLPRDVMLSWRPVPGTSTYYIEVQRYNTAAKQWDIYSVTGSTGPFETYKIVFIYDPGKYQWRVTALSAAGEWLDSKPTAWRSFTFIN